MDSKRRNVQLLLTVDKLSRYIGLQGGVSDDVAGWELRLIPKYTIMLLQTVLFLNNSGK